MPAKQTESDLKQKLRELEKENAILTADNQALKDSATRYQSFIESTEEKLINFKQAVDASTDAIGMSTAQGDHYYQNTAFDNLFGPIGNDPPSTLYADEKIGREIFESIMGGTPWIGEVEMHGKNNKILNILLRAYPTMDSDGKVRRLFGVHTNITKQKQTEKELQKHRAHLQDLVKERTRELQESEARFQQISDNINDVFYLYSVDYKKVYYVSRGFEKIWEKTVQGYRWLPAHLFYRQYIRPHTAAPADKHDRKQQVNRFSPKSY